MAEEQYHLHSHAEVTSVSDLERLTFLWQYSWLLDLGQISVSTKMKQLLSLNIYYRHGQAQAVKKVRSIFEEEKSGNPFN